MAGGCAQPAGDVENPRRLRRNECEQRVDQILAGFLVIGGFGSPVAKVTEIAVRPEVLDDADIHRFVVGLDNSCRIGAHVFLVTSAGEERVSGSLTGAMSTGNPLGASRTR